MGHEEHSPVDDARPRLDGWKAIAAFFERTDRAVQAWEQDGLKIHRFHGRVWAYIEDLEDYRSKRLILPSDIEGPSRQMEHDIPVNDVPSLPDARSGHRLRNLVWSVTSVLALALVWLGLSGAEPASCQISGDSLVAYDGGGKEAWRYSFRKGFHAFRYGTPRLMVESCVVADVDGDGWRELLFVYNSPRADAENSLLYAFASPRNWNRIVGPEVLGIFEPGHKLIISSHAAEVYEPPYIMQPSTITLLNRPGHGNRVLVVSVHNQGAATQVAVLDDHLKLVSEYWHPGHLLHVTTEDLFHDGRDRVLLAGVNNGEHSGTLLVFDPENLSGTPLGVTDHRFALTSYGEDQFHQTVFAAGTEEVSIAFPRSCVARGKKQPYNRVSSLWTDPTKIVVVVAEDQSQGTTDQLLYNLRYDFSLIEVLPQGSFAASHEVMEKSRMCVGPLWPVGVQSIAGNLLVRRGTQ
jgi:hypothetical protein